MNCFDFDDSKLGILLNVAQAGSSYIQHPSGGYSNTDINGHDIPQ